MYEFEQELVLSVRQIRRDTYVGGRGGAHCSGGGMPLTVPEKWEFIIIYPCTLFSYNIAVNIFSYRAKQKYLKHYKLQDCLFVESDGYKKDIFFWIYHAIRRLLSHE